MSGLSLKEDFVLCPLLVVGGKRERGERCFLQITVRFICQETAEQYKPFPPPPPRSPPPLSRYISSSPCCQSAPVFSYHRSSCSCSLTIDIIKENNHQNICLKKKKKKAKSTLQYCCTAVQRQFNVL